jgi:hypothetical protein
VAAQNCCGFGAMRDRFDPIVPFTHRDWSTLMRYYNRSVSQKYSPDMLDQLLKRINLCWIPTLSKLLTNGIIYNLFIQLPSQIEYFVELRRVNIYLAMPLIITEV